MRSSISCSAASFLCWMTLCCEGFAPLPVYESSSLRSRTSELSATGAGASVQNNSESKGRDRKRDRFLRTLGFRASGDDPSTTATALPKNEITTLEQLNRHWQDQEGLFQRSGGRTDYTALLRAASVKGDTQVIGSPAHPDYTHPVVQLLHERRRRRLGGTNATTANDDGAKVALAVEGGGMRGCVSAGMICAVHYLNLTDSIDVVYGSSAGTVVGAYLVTGQLPWFGPEVYYDRLTTAGRDFINTRRLLRALGLGLLDPRLLKDVVMRRQQGGKPVLNLPFLLKTTVQETKPLDWNKFVERQKVLPLNVVTSGLRSEKSIVLNMANGGFETLEELTDSMHASCLIPGIAGPLMNIDKRVLTGERPRNGGDSPPKFVVANNLKGDQYEPLADGLLYEPLPYRTAITEDGVTHCIVIRSRPDGVDVTGKGGLFERLIASRFFRRKNNLPRQYQRMKMHLHKFIYAEDVIRLNEEAYSKRDYKDTSKPHLMAIAAPPGSPEVTRLEVGREAIFEGIRRGFARAYDCLVEDPNERGRGMEMAKRFFPDEILDYEPLDIAVTNQSAFEAYMQENGIAPKSWEAERMREELLQV